MVGAALLNADNNGVVRLVEKEHGAAGVTYLARSGEVQDPGPIRVFQWPALETADGAVEDPEKYSRVEKRNDGRWVKFPVDGKAELEHNVVCPECGEPMTHRMTFSGDIDVKGGYDYEWGKKAQSNPDSALVNSYSKRMGLDKLPGWRDV